jgi:hypothetical protein
MYSWNLKKYAAFSGGLFTVLAGADYYYSHRDNIDVNDPKFPLRKYKICHDRIKLHGAMHHRSPDVVTINYTLFYPRNGEIVEARYDPALYPEWLQLRNGRWIMREDCGVELCVPVDPDDPVSKNPHDVVANPDDVLKVDPGYRTVPPTWKKRV